jgi:hypothetical protein
METSLTDTKTEMAVAVTQPGEIQNQVTATTPDAMTQSQSGMIAWFKRKVVECYSELDETTEAYEHAVKQKWSSSALKRMADKASKRLTFYRKVLAALEHGFVMIPNFPVTAFAIRTDKKNPLKMMSTRSWNNSHEQESQMKPAGEGNYKNPFPEICQRTIKEETPTTNALINYWAEAWKEMEFPLTMAKPRIMEATTNAMALKIFDDLCILPERRTKGDPMILARIFDGTSPYKGNFRKHVTFLVAWHVDLRTI